jgi:hypothetical protein
MAKKRPMSEPMLPVLPDEFQRGAEAGPEVRAMPMSERDMTPTREQEARMRRQVEDDRMLRDMEKAYESSRRSMGSRYAQGGSVSSASKRADGCAQRGKTKGRII